MLMQAIGLDCYVVGGQTSKAGGGYTGHAWCEMVIDEIVYVFDPQVEDNIAKGGTINYYRFGKTYEQVPEKYIKANIIETVVEGKEGNFEYVIQNQEVTITNFTGYDLLEAVVPQEIQGYPVTGIGERAFEGCSNLNSIKFPNSITYIGRLAFSDCSSLISMELPEGITRIHYATFNNCSNLNNVILPKTVTYIEEDAFWNCIRLVSIDLPQNITKIEDGTFAHCSTLSDVTIGNGVTSIGAHAFSHCNSLNVINIPETVVDIGSNAFWNCKNLTNIYIPSSVTSIDNDAFEDCDSLMITTSEGSYAESYAKEKEIPYIN